MAADRERARRERRVARAVDLPSVAAPSVNVTVPVGVPDADATCAVSVTDWPTTDGLFDAARVVAVGVIAPYARVKFE